MNEILVPPPPEIAYATFAGVIDQAAVGRIFNACSVGLNTKISHIHLLFQSPGGSIGDGVCLYNYFRALPLDLTIYNVGNVSSAATLAFLGAKHRKTSAFATFMIHKTHSPGVPATAQRLHSVAHSVVVDDQRVEAILRRDLKLTDDQWKVHEVAELWMTAADAVTCGLAEIGEFCPPPRVPIFNI